MRKIGNLFNLAEKRLIREKHLGIIPCYTELDVIEYAVKIRRFLDHNPPSKIKRIMKLTKADLIRKAKLNRRKRD
jgi:hypothetical protein